jgi:Ca2+-binding RTX toxin-like protein
VAIIRIWTPPARGEPASHTPNADFVRGTAADDFLNRPLTRKEARILDQVVDLGVPTAEVLDAIVLGDLRRMLNHREEQGLLRLLNKPGADLVASLTVLEDKGSRPFSVKRDPKRDVFDGADRFFAEGGSDYIADLKGHNLVSTGDGNDHILLGKGNDRIFDRGGNNTIHDLGGRNLITTRDGNDTITTGRGDDNIIAFDGRNLIDAGGGDNIVRGGNGFDSVTVGSGNDMVEVRNGSAGETERFNLPDIGIVRFKAHNVVLDQGGSDNIRAIGSSRNTDADSPDPLFNGNDLVLSDLGLKVFGNDTIEVGGGNNLIVDFGGHNTVRTLEGDDIIFTSFASRGRDDISSGFGNDVINPGSGRDVVHAGPGEDLIFLEDDGQLDRIVYLESDRTGSPLTTDVVLGFDGRLDVLDVSSLGLDLSNLLVFNAALFGLSVGEEDAKDIVIAWDVDRNDKISDRDFFTTVLADFNERTLRPSNFLFDADDLV